MSKTSPENKVRTSATVSMVKFKIFKSIANLKHDKDPLNSAWEEAVTLYLRENREYANKLSSEIENILK